MNTLISDFMESNNDTVERRSYNFPRQIGIMVKTFVIPDEENEFPKDSNASKCDGKESLD